METKANYIATGVFTLAVIVGAFGFIFWFQNTGRSAWAPFHWNPTCAVHVFLTKHAMGATMPFSKYVIDPEHIETMRTAFNRVCDARSYSSATATTR